MFILDDGIKLDCKVDKPANIGDKMPLAIVIHGFTGKKERSGYDCVRIVIFL